MDAQIALPRERMAAGRPDAGTQGRMGEIPETAGALDRGRLGVSPDTAGHAWPRR